MLEVPGPEIRILQEISSPELAGNRRSPKKDCIGTTGTTRTPPGGSGGTGGSGGFGGFGGPWP